ncbi:hypothetical protein SARC_03922 [Sphaeroforma arctica JP610]|uniref:Uncharacterized protein n=1 Tax=Sphaeroforma arctica JP610 TaxID=667725 RepID=A0A0L0G459_9EUKA|nr:hypothetical protein SARC_03922 [Sphaeroforma arctica JP610]KNC83840.1 hypothetical protein SARC_03922 [Sphaeroforma arctica JP610]|eukprot:XP_014157742.1 hypothetical protein SARC_03922 [Sphaeroforma arctica JP610]
MIIDRLRPHAVDYLLKKFLNDMQNKTLNVEGRTERAQKTMKMLEERCRNSDKEPIHFQLLKVQRYQALMYYGQQVQVDALIKADIQPDGSEGHLSDIDTKFHTMTESNIRAASKLREQRKRHNAQATNHGQAQSRTTTTNKRHKPDNGVPNQTKPTGQTQEKKGAREKRACLYCKEMPAPHRFSLCPKKATNQAKQADEQVKKDVQIARLSITSGKVDGVTEGDEL